MYQREEKLKKFIRAEEFSFWKSLNFCYMKLSRTIEEGKKEMQHLILFQTVTVLSEEFVFKGEERMKNKDNFICAEDISFREN